MDGDGDYSGPLDEDPEFRIVGEVVSIAGATLTWRPVPEGDEPNATARERAEIAARTYKRDRDGKFSSGGGGGVRQSLQDASTTEAVAGVLKSEASRILGRDVDVNLAGLDADVARVHAEGILRGAEASPTAALERVWTYGPGSTLGHPSGLDDTTTALTVDDQDIMFNTRYGRMDDLAGAMSRHDAVGYIAGAHGDLTRVAVHEMGHVVDGTSGGRLRQAALRIALQRPSAGHVEREISTYAGTDSGELFAEAFTDVVSRGSGASALSHQIFNEMAG